MKIEKYKPKYHHNPDNCTDNCEKDCDMECDNCRASPYNTEFYYIIQGENTSIQLCQKCFLELKKCLKGGMNGKKSKS